MNVLVLGANGAVGQIVMVELLKSNHEVTALARSAGAIQLKHPQLIVVQGIPPFPCHASDLSLGRIHTSGRLQTDFPLLLVGEHWRDGGGSP